MPDSMDGKHGAGNKPGTAEQQKNWHKNADPKDNKTAKDTGYDGRHRKG